MKKTFLKTPVRSLRSRFGTALAKLVLVLAGSVLLHQAAQAQVILSPLWSIATTNGSPYTYINTDGSQRGLAYNPTTDHIYVVSGAAGSRQVYVLNAFTGAHIGQLDVTGISGGGGANLNLIDVAEDGSIYVCNLATSANTFRLYRYTNETSAPLLVYLGDPGYTDTNAVVSNSKRFGDNFSVRGSGTNVQVLVNSRGGRVSSLLFPADADLTNFVAQTILTDAANGDLGLGAAFGSGDNFWGKASARNLRRLTISNPASLYDTNIALVAVTTINSNILPNTTTAIGTLANSNLLALIDPSGHTLRLYDTTAGVTLQDSKAFQLPTAANGNGTGTAEFGTKTGTNYVWGLDSNNGLVAYVIVPVSAPVIGSSPANLSILDGGYGTMSVIANGTAPLTYRWFKADTNTLTTNLVTTITGNGNLNFTNVTPASAGLYSVIVSNSSGTATSAVAVLTIGASTRSDVAAKLWQLPAGSRAYLTSDNNQRGIAYHALSNQVLVVNRSGGLSVRLLNADTGADAGQLDVSTVVAQAGAEAGFLLNMIGVADDGAIYGCNLAAAAGGGFTIYRWADADPATVPTIAYGPDNPLFSRTGDAFAVSGAGANTRLFAATRTNTQVAVFTTGDGLSFSANTVDVTTAPGGFAGLGLAAGEGDTFWAKSAGELLRKVFYDIPNGTNEVQAAINGAGGANIAIDNSNEFAATISSGDTPSNVRLSDIRNPSPNAVLLDQEFFGSDNANGNNTGAVAFDIAGGRIFALDSNNGILALKYAPRVKQDGAIITWTGPGTLQASANVTGSYTNVTGATSPYTNNAAGPLFFRVQR